MLRQRRRIVVDVTTAVERDHLDSDVPLLRERAMRNDPAALVSCPTSFYDFSASHGVCGKARPAGNGPALAKGRNAATGPVRRALRELAVRTTAALRPFPICWILAADRALHWRAQRTLKS